MKRVLITFIAFACAVLPGCGTTMTTKESGFLSSYAGLSISADDASAGRAPLVAIDPSRITLGDVSIQAIANASLTTPEREALVELLRTQLAQGVAQIPQNARGRAAVLRASITRVEVVSPALNTVSTLLLIGPVDRGGAAVEMEAVDPVSGEQLAALKLGYYAPLSDIKARFARMDSPEIAIRKAAGEFVSLLGNPASQQQGAK